MWILTQFQAFYILYGALQVLSLGAIFMPDTIKTQATVANVVVILLATFTLAVVSNFEHYRNARPSSPIGIYLTITFVFDITRVRTLYAVKDAKPLANMLLLATLIKFGLLILELKEKRAWLINERDFPAPEATANFYNRLTFFWVNPLLLKGFKNPIQEHDLYEVQEQIIGEKNILALAEKWEKCTYSSGLQSLIR